MNKKGIVYRYIAEEVLKDRKKKFNVRSKANRELRVKELAELKDSSSLLMV